MTQVTAAERVRFQYGPFYQSIPVKDLETFIGTGELSPELAGYASLLSPDQLVSLRRGLLLNPDISKRALPEMLRSPMGERLMQVLNLVVKNTNPAELAAVVSRASEMPSGLNLINMFRAFPGQEMAIDARVIMGVKAQLEADYNTSKALSAQLTRDLFRKDAVLAPQSIDPAVPGPFAIQEQPLLITDQRRQRQISLVVYAPAAPGLKPAQGPLVVLFHGLGGTQNALAYLARHLSSHGFTVVTLKHPGHTALERSQDEYTLGGELYMPAQEFIERPQDVSFALDQLKRLNKQPGLWRGKFNTRQVTVIGQSLGGTSALLLAGGEPDLESLRATCKAIAPIGEALGDWAICNATALPGNSFALGDRRVVQAITINPNVGDLFGPQGLSQVHAAVLMVSSTDDAIAPAITNHLRPFNQLPSPKYLLTAVGASHMSVNDQTNLRNLKRVRVVSEQIGDQYLPLQQLFRGLTLAFVKQLTPQAEQYQPFLSPAYAQSLSSEAVPLRLNTSLPDSIVQHLNQ